MRRRGVESPPYRSSVGGSGASVRSYERINFT
jgi:hypothetical protein